MLAELLLVECRNVVRSAPREAESFASLIASVLAWTRSETQPWARPLMVLATAYRANAIRVGGDLPVADGAYLKLRRDLAAKPLRTPSVRGEILSLEASLRIDQRRFTEAGDLLCQAELLLRHAGDERLLYNVQMKQANLLRNQGQLEQALMRLDSMASRLGDRPKPARALPVVTCRVNVLCDLDRFTEAENLLSHYRGAFEAVDDPFAGAVLRGLEGRVALGRGRLQEAAEYFVDCRDAYLTLGRPYDAALASLDLAQAHHEAGRSDEVRRLSADLVPLFRAHGVPREALAAIHLLTQALVQQRVNAALLQELRREIEAHRQSPRPSDD
jgi:ATP/maltotriose-dependent transcriptional regulator MalT